MVTIGVDLHKPVSQVNVLPPQGEAQHIGSGATATRRWILIDAATSG